MQNDKNLEKLGAEIEKARGVNSGPTDETEDSSGVSPLRVGVELVSGVVVGAGAGLLLDRWLHTSPLFFLCFFVLGVLGSGMNIYRLAKSQKSDK